MDVKIYRTKDGQNFSLEPILNDERCTENQWDIASIYTFPDDIKIIISGERLQSIIDCPTVSNDMLTNGNKNDTI